MGSMSCISCGYDLSAHTSESRRVVTCPECGEKDAAREPVRPTATPFFCAAGTSFVLSIMISGVFHPLGYQAAYWLCFFSLAAMVLQGAGCLRLARRDQAGEPLARAKLVVGSIWLLMMVWWWGVIVLEASRRSGAFA
jgi:predicted RNA-binding Zn-ribbon protein involved in translation (DUF1610 family)